MKKINLIERLLSYSHEKQKTQRFGRYAVMLLMLLTLGVGQMWADSSVTGGEIYFDAYTTGWGSVTSVEYAISHDSYSRWWAMTHIPNTYLYYKQSESWSDAKYIGFTANFGWDNNAEGNSYDHRKVYGGEGSKYTAKSNYGVNSGSTYLFYASGSNNDEAIATSSPAGYLGAGKTYADLNYTQTLNQTLSTDAGSTFSASTAAIATVSVSSYKLNGASSSTSDAGTISSGSSSTSCDAARTATVTYSVSSVNSGYHFVGWYEGDTQKSTNTSYTYNATEAKTITARFIKLKTITIKFLHEANLGWTIQGVTKYPTSGGQSISADGTWVTLTFTNVYAVSNIDLAYNGGDWDELKYSTITDDCCYFTDGSSNPGCKEATISATRTSPAYVAAGVGGQVTLSITSSSAKSGWKYRIYNGTGYESPDNVDASSNSASWTMTGGVNTGSNSYIVILEDGSGNEKNRTSAISVTGETAYSTTISAGSHGSVSPNGTVYANNNNVHPSITATPSDHYHFVEWTPSDANASVASGSSATTTVTATSAGTTITASFAGDEYTITYYDQGGSEFSGTQEDAPATHTYGTATTLKIPTKEHYMFGGWYTASDCASGQVGNTSSASLGATDYTANITLYAKWIHSPTLASVTATPASYNYVGSDITLNLSATSTYLEHPIVVFLVNDGIGTYQVTGAAYGADGAQTIGTIGAAGSNYQTVHKASFAIKAAGTYTVTAKLYEGELVDNFEGTNTKGWAGDNLGADGAISFGANNPGRMAGNGSSKVLQITRAGVGAQQWGGAILRFASVDDRAVCDASGSNEYAYIHARMKDATSATELKNNDASGNDSHISPSFDGSSSADWRHVTYHNTHCSNNFLLFMIQQGNTENKTVYIDDVILSNNATWAPVKDENDEDVSAVASAVVINQTYDITIVGGRVAVDNSATTIKASADVTNSLAGTAYVHADDVESGMKFTGWKLSTGVSLKEGSTLTSRSIEFYAVGNGTVTAQYEKRNKVDVYFAAVPGWTNIYAYAWQASNTSNNNGSYPGDELISTISRDGVTFYRYSYYTEGDGADESAEGDAAWDRVIFNKGDGSTTPYPKENWNKTKDLTLVNGHYYHFADGESGSEYYYDWYVMGKWNGEATWNYTHPIDYTDATIVRDLENGTIQYFKVYRASTDQWFKYDPSGVGGNVDAPVGSAITLREYNDGDNKFEPDATAGYRFTLVKHNTNPTLTIEKMTDQDVSVTVEAGANGSITTGPSTIHVYTTTTIVAAPNAGYRFKKWTVDDAHKNYIQIADTTSATTTIYAKYASLGEGATITAHFSNENMIYCDASSVYDTWGLSSNKLYVCLYSSAYWNNDRGTGASGSQCFVKTAEMTQIGSSKVYYYDYSGSGHKDGSDGNPDFNYVAFINKYLPSAGDFAEASVTYRGDFYPSAGRLYVIERTTPVMKNTTAAYYNEGFWMKYREEEAGIKLKIYDGSNQQLYGSPFTFTRENLDVRTFTTTMKLNGSSEYRMELLGDNGIYYKNSGHMYTDNCTNWQFTEREKTVGYINTSGEGNYTFTLDCGNTTAGQMKMSATYPLHAGDYRIVYNGKTNTEAVSAGEFIGPTIKKWTSGTQKDTVSFFVVDRKDAGMDWNFDIQSCSIDESTVTWNDVAGKTGITIPALNGDTGVYIFEVKQTSASDITIGSPAAYKGDYYIRTDIAEGRWEAYKEAPDNKMVHSDWAEKHSDYNYYHCHYTPNGKSVKFTIANDYSSSISGELNSDSYTTGDGKLNANANVRFSYNSATNVIKRTYIGGSAEDNYLNIVSPTAGYVYAENGTTDLNGASAYTRKFTDMGNWVYQMDIQAYPTSQAKVTAYYNGNTQYMIGSEEAGETIIGGDSKGSKKYKLRVVYDFKNNHLISSWVADGNTITGDLILQADLMIVRHLQEAGVQISFNDVEEDSILDIKTIYGAIRFDYNDMVNQMPNWNASGIYGKLIYYISFPFDVNVKDIFGSAGNIEDQWIVQSYNGERRAKEGWFADSKPFWETLTVDSVMKAGRGYVLIIDRPSFNSPSSVVWTNKTSGSSVYLYFPSVGASGQIIGGGTQTVTVPPHKCNIERTFTSTFGSGVLSHTVTDSHWNMIGAPVFANTSASEVVVDSTDFHYVYDWNSGLNTYNIRSNVDGFTFKVMHGYMAQFTGKVTFSGVTLAASVAARQLADNKKYNVELRMTDENDVLSRAYVELRENACDTFLLNEDVYMMRSSNTVDLFTLAGNYDVAANVLSIGNHVVPVGMDVKKAGTYTFSMPSNFSGTVTLVDTQTGTRTNLALENYQVYLNQGPINGRFFLDLDIQETTTSLEEINGEGSIKDGKAQKFLKNGIMYILKNGVVYDAQGNRVK